ncbi:MAG: ABC transporter substrate-binding protein, partial [Dehalococcoidia bacterium]
MRNLVLFLSALTAVAFVACSSDSDLTATAVLQAPAATAPALPPTPTTVPPAPTSAPAPTAPPAAPAPADHYPVTVTDLLGRSVTISAPPERILTIMPTATETLYRIGGQAIGRDTASRYPPEAQDVETVGGAYNPSLEAMAVLEPDLIVIEALTQGHLVGMLEGLGAPVVAVRANSLEDVEQSLAVLGAATDREDAAALAATEIRAAVEVAIGEIDTPPTMLILISDADRNIYAAKPESY